MLPAGYLTPIYLPSDCLTCRRTGSRSEPPKLVASGKWVASASAVDSFINPESAQNSIEFPLLIKQPLTGLAHSAVTAGIFCCELSGLSDLLASVSHSHADTRALYRRQVRQIVTNVGNLFQFKIML